MLKEDLIELIEDEMVCANDCPMKGKNSMDYDVDFCGCYKAKVISEIKGLFDQTKQAKLAPTDTPPMPKVKAPKPVSSIYATKDAYFEDQIVKDLHHVMSLVATDKTMWNDLGYDGQGHTAEEIIGFMLKSLAERGSKLACSGDLKDMVLPGLGAPIPHKEVISIQPGDVVVVSMQELLSTNASDRIKAMMSATFPDTKALILDNGMSLEVYREQDLKMADSKPVDIEKIKAAFKPPQEETAAPTGNPHLTR